MNGEFNEVKLQDMPSLNSPRMLEEMLAQFTANLSSAITTRIHKEVMDELDALLAKLTYGPKKETATAIGPNGGDIKRKRGRPRKEEVQKTRSNKNTIGNRKHLS